MWTLSNLIDDPKNPEHNFSLGQEYEMIGQTASAVSFYLRCAEFGRNKLLSYEALLRIFLCLEKQGSRFFVAKGVLQRAIALMPHRPEAYFLLSRHYQRNRQWNDSLSFAVAGDLLNACAALRTDVEYPGQFGFNFQRAVASWWVGLYDESLATFAELIRDPEVSASYKDACRDNIKRLSDSWKDPIIYDQTMYERLRYKFPGAKDIKRNYSQCFQDLFVLTMLEGKTNGRYLEIGSGDPYYGSNTALLEKLGWDGISVDLNADFVESFRKARKNQCYQADATKMTLPGGDFDYLQIDIDPSTASLEVLLKIPFERTRFAVITFEHDYYRADNQVKERSREYLRSFGYELVVSNIAPDAYRSFEDWWVAPELVSRAIIDRIKDTSEAVKKADEFMLN